MISKEDVIHIAKLARLELTDNEIKKFQKDMSEILDYFNLLKKAPKPKALPDNKNLKTESLRKDEVVSNFDIREKIILSAPDKKEGYIKVKTVF